MLDSLEKSLQELENEIKDTLKTKSSPITNFGVEFLESGGKRLRPMLVLLSGQCFSKITKDLIITAAVSELIHMASLIHDDIIDNSHLRRGKKTINSKMGNHVAVLTGDFLFAKAFSLMSKYKLYDVMGLMVKSIEEMCHGEVNQAIRGLQIQQRELDYYRVIFKKTAHLLGICCRCGAMAAGAGDKEAKIMEKFGINLGFAFQIADDILDYTGDITKMGKPRGSDLLQGNFTLPLIDLIKDINYKEKIEDAIKEGRINEEFGEEIYNDLITTGSLMKVFSKAEKFQEKAIKFLKMLPRSAARDELEKLSLKVVKREH